MTSSLRNSIHRRNHKERSQLAHRTKLGILEKHKDYVKRAKDYHSKQDRLNRLRQKAAERNKDEFYFAMNREKTRGGVHVKDRGNVALPTDIVKVLKTQDENYVRTARAAGRKKIDKIKSQLMSLADLVKSSSVNDSEGSDDDEHLEQEDWDTLREAGVIPSNAKGKKRSKHIVFVDNDDEARKYAERKSPPPSPIQVPRSNGKSRADDSIDLGWKQLTAKSKKRRHPHSVEEADEDDTEEQKATEQLAHTNRKKLLKELSARLKRDKMLRYTEREFEMQRLLMGKGGRRKIHGVEKMEGSDSEDENDRPMKKGQKTVDEQAYKPRVYKWRRERKR